MLGLVLDNHVVLLHLLDGDYLAGFPPAAEPHFSEGTPADDGNRVEVFGTEFFSSRESTRKMYFSRLIWAS